ncbi:hypothetical protein SSP24_82530 [Streptomyces spinoverrucosus]|uniref:Uncharacterized protein n=1 Tax=Streptomyces spinoverrucosus TaxID=284043 RepID=A0A4Y3VWJ1_9ACTN|nr:hypothetical protein [Streptomyces spinoverrucosus]GEC10598.1 hypothetical protein SSP24_82530 [Streptomyces spinoverrucosus]GHB73078.1 hypothetical protein GCM10010397_49400 [Streptomyces spinoverrucosus]
MLALTPGGQREPAVGFGVVVPVGLTVRADGHLEGVTAMDFARQLGQRLAVSSPQLLRTGRFRLVRGASGSPDPSGLGLYNSERRRIGTGAA